MNKVLVLKELNNRQIDQILEIVISASEIDGARPFSEHVELHLRSGGDRPVTHLIAEDENKNIVGYAHLDTTDLVAGPSGELVVCPKSRKKGIATLLLKEMKNQISNQPLRLWSHGDTELARNFATKLGFVPVRNVIQMRRSLFSQIDPLFEIEGLTFRNFDANNDSSKFLELNKKCFAKLPDQANWTLKDLELRLKESWFKADGFVLLENKNKDLVGFCWTKIHGQDHEHVEYDGHTHHSHGHEPIGEIYVLGVDPEHQGKGIGKLLTLWGLNYLRRAGLDSAMLYVDSNNKNAIDLYTSLGFNFWGVDKLYISNTYEI